MKAPAGAPNVLLVLTDDMGFGVSESFGGPITTPTMEKLAANGLRYNRFHTTALCSPTRVALLTGYNHHSNNMGCIAEAATTFPGNTAVRPQSITPMAEVLRQNGYNTAAFGEYHETPPWEISNSSPQDRWPTRSGFEKSYGFIGGGIRYRKQLAQEIQKNHPGIDLFTSYQGLAEPEDKDQRMRYPVEERLAIYRILMGEFRDAGGKFMLGCEFPKVWERLGLDWKAYIGQSVYQFQG